MKVLRCYVVNEKNEVVIHGARVFETVYRDINCKELYGVVIKYSTDMFGENEITAIMPSESVFYFTSEE